MKVYLDYASTSPIKPEVREAILPFLKDKFGNPSSIHSWGQEAKLAVEDARESVAKFLGCSSSEVIFTSGGTESDNLAIQGFIKGLGSPRSLQPPYPAYCVPPKAGLQPAFARGLPSAYKYSLPHIITTQIEHHAVLKTCENLEKIGLAEVTYLKPNRDGLITVEQVKKALKKNTVLVSVMYVNNEIGTIQPIREIGKMIEAENRKRLDENRKQLGKQKKENGRKADFQSPTSKPISDFCQPISKLYFHTDAVQAVEYLNMNVDFLHVDLLTISAHKIGGLKGAGALYIRKNTPLKKIIFGGEQEVDLRAGTENVTGIMGLGKAIEVLGDEHLELRAEKVRKLRDYFIKRVLKEIADVELNGSKEKRSPNNANFYFKYVEGESILLNLDLVGIAASSGSACTSRSLEPSHVLPAVFNDPQRAHGSVRFTLGIATTKEEIDYVIKNLKEIIKKLRKMSPLTPRPNLRQEGK